MTAKTSEVRAFWRAYCAARAVEHDSYLAVMLGDSAALADELAELIACGPKRATATLLRDFAPGGERLPVVGDHVVILDGGGRPRCICQTTEVRIKAFIEVDDAFAWDEGEGDRTRADWLAMHRAYFGRQAVREGFEFDDRIPTVFERFAVVWP
jgi:uncharacterized protein YhfF